MDKTVGTYASRKDAEYAIEALTTMGGFDEEIFSIIQAEVDSYSVVVEGEPSLVRQARAFLQGSPPKQETNQEASSPYGLKHARDLMALDDFG